MPDAVTHLRAPRRSSHLRSLQLLTAMLAFLLATLAIAVCAQAGLAAQRAHRASRPTGCAAAVKGHSSSRSRARCLHALRIRTSHGHTPIKRTPAPIPPAGSGSGSTPGQPISGKGTSGEGPASGKAPTEGSSGGPATPPPATEEEKVTLPPSTGTAFGFASNSDPINQAPRAARVDAKLLRVEFPIATPVSQIEPTIAALAENGEKALLLAGFAGRIPSAEEAAHLATWAHAFGPGGTFWAGRSDGQLAVQAIEFGNETNQSYQFNGCSWNCPSYIPRAEGYALALKTAQVAIDGPNGNSGVGMLAIGDDGGTGSENWLNGMFKAVPDLGTRIIGWTAHTYGPKPNWQPMIDHMISWTQAHGAPSSLPIYVTEFGFSSDNGTCLSNNYGWNPCLTYTQAAEDLSSDVSEFLSTYGSRVAAMMLYEVSDLSPTRTTTEREQYFGTFQSNGSPKGAYTEMVKSLMETHPAPMVLAGATASAKQGVKASRVAKASASRAVAARVAKRARAAHKAHHRRGSRRHHRSRASSRAARSRAARR
jgi:hypothetical protein